MNHNGPKLSDLDPQWMTIPAAAKYAGVSASTMYRLVKEGLISYYKHPDLKTKFCKEKVFINKISIDNYWGKEFVPSIKNLKEEPPHAKIRFS